MSRSNWALLGFLAIAGFFLLTEHKAHALGILPFLLLLACPLLHRFHHGGHGAREGNDDGERAEKRPEPPGRDEHRA